MHATSNWNHNTSFDEVCRRASGRRAYNALRQFRARYRLMQMIDYANEVGVNAMARGFQSRLAERFGVSRSTISRDLARLRDERLRAYDCPTCGHPLMVQTRL